VKLSSQLVRFRTWCAEYRATHAQRDPEWERGYPDWVRLHAAVEDLLRLRAFSGWSAAELRDVLHVLACDHDGELVDMLADGLPVEDFLALTRAALADAEPAARRQLADRLPEVAALEPDQVDALLRQLAADPDEQVRQRALAALDRIEADQRGTRTRA